MLRHRLVWMTRFSLVLRSLSAAWVLAIALHCLSAGGQVMQGRIPAVHANSFSNEMVTLPEGLKGKVGVLVLGFSRGSREGTTVWGKRLSADYRESPAVLYYEMPVLAAVPKMIRGFVINQIRSSVPEQERPRFVVLLEDETAWQTLVGYKNADDAYIVVVDDQGVVRWQTHGAATDAAYGAMKQQVEALRAGMGQGAR